MTSDDKQTRKAVSQVANCCESSSAERVGCTQHSGAGSHIEAFDGGERSFRPPELWQVQTHGPELACTTLDFHLSVLPVHHTMAAIQISWTPFLTKSLCMHPAETSFVPQLISQPRTGAGSHGSARSHGLLAEQRVSPGSMLSGMEALLDEGRQMQLHYVKGA